MMFAAIGAANAPTIGDETWMIGTSAFKFA